MDFCLVTPEEMIPTKEEVGQYKVWTCFPYEDNRYVEIYRIDIEPGAIYISGGHGEKTREYLTVTDGVITVECHGQSQTVSKEQVLVSKQTRHTHIEMMVKREQVVCAFFWIINSVKDNNYYVLLKCTI